MEKAAGGEEFGVEKGGTGGAADEVVRKQREFDVEEGTFADTADYGGHTVSGVNVAAGLRAILLIEDDNRTPHGGRQRCQL